MPHLAKDTVVQWCDEAVIHTISDRSGSDDALYNLELEVSGMPIHAVCEGEGDPLRLVCRPTFDAETLSLLTDMDAERRNFHTLVTSVITNTKGAYTFLDDDKNPCEFGELRHIQFEHRIYPQNATRQEFMDSVLELGSAAQFIIQATENLRSEVDSTR